MDAQPVIDQDPRGLLANIRCFALDLDGTVYLGNRVIDGAPEFLRAIRATGRRFVFMTNNSSKDAQSYLQKLAAMGLDTAPEQLVTSGGAAIRYLRREHPGQRVYLLGNPLLQEEFRRAGIALSEENPQVVVAGYDTSLTYEKLCAVCAHLRDGLPFIATHPDINCPSESGFLPDLGSFLALIEASTGRRPDAVMGKPNREIIDCMLEQAQALPAETMVVGDRLYTDIAAGKNAGMATALVLSGETKPGDLESSETKPDLVFTSVRALAALL